MALIRWQATVQDEAGNAVVNPSITVRNALDNSLASIFDDAGVAKLNPFSGGLDGFVSFKAAPGRYIIQGASGAESVPDWTVDLTEVAFDFTSREDLVDALTDNRIPDGAFVRVRGVLGVVDATATGTLSALNDLGVDGVKIVGEIIRSDWWLDGSAGDKSALVQAMNTYADAWYGTGTAACTLVFSGVIQIANQVTIGTAGTGTLKAFNIDAAGAVFDVITGGNLESTAQITALVIRNCHRSMIQFAQIKCNHICGGVTVESCSNTVFDGLHLHQFDWRGLWVKGLQSDPSTSNSAGAVFLKVTGSEWTSGEAGFQDDRNFVSDGITNESNDVRFAFAHIGWCRRAIVNNAGSCEYISCHPFNGNASNPENAEHRICFWNDGNSAVQVSDMYGDNGYVIDNAGGMDINGMTVLDLNSTMAEPYLRVNRYPDHGAPSGQFANVRTSAGYYTTEQQADETDPIVILAMGQSNMRSHTDMVTSNGNNVVQNGVYIWNGATGVVGSAFIPAAYGTFPLDINVAGVYASNLAIATANNLRACLGRPVYVILMAAAAVEIERFITPATLAANSWTATTDFTATIFSQVAAALALVPGRAATHVDYLLWHQGEANSADSAAVYANKWLAMESDFRAQGIFTNANTILVGGQLRDGHAFGATLTTAWNTIQSTKSNAILTSSAGIPYEGTTPHFTGAGIEEFGGRYAWSAMSKPSAMPYSSTHYDGRRWRVEGNEKNTRYITGALSPDEDWYKEGTSTAEIVHRYNPGSGATISTRFKDGTMYVTSGSGDEGMLSVNKASKVGIGSFTVTDALQLWAGGSAHVRVTVGGNMQPETDNTQLLGSGPNRWATVYAGTGTINTSDEREKQDVRDISEAERAVAVSLKALFKAFRFKDAVALKGDKARIHFGIMAQDAAAAFEAEGLDPMAYGIICYDEWDEQVDAAGNVIPAGNLWGIRYDELNSFIIMAT